MHTAGTQTTQGDILRMAPSTAATAISACPSPGGLGSSELVTGKVPGGCAERQSQGRARGCGAECSTCAGNGGMVK